MSIRDHIDPGLRKEIADTACIDGHAHPLPLGIEPEGDLDYPIQPYALSLPRRMRPDNPEYLDAWASLWGYEHRDWELEHLQQLMLRKRRVMAEQGQGYNVWVLDQLKFQTMITMAYGPSASEPEPRFRFCGRADWLLWPFPSRPMPDDFPVTRSFLSVVDQACKAQGLDTLPPTLDGYVSRIMITTLDRYKKQAAVGLKFQTPYYRGLDFADVSFSDAATLYERGVKEGGLAVNDLKALQDYLFRALVQRAGDYDFVIQMHTGLGVRPNFNITGSNPLLMEPVIHAAPRTRFLLLHGGWPFHRETVALLAQSNVYTDFSCANIYKYARALCDQIRPALEWFPEKLLYGTDAYSDRSLAMLAGVAALPNPLSGWEEKAWLMDRAGRDALGLALTGMREDGDISWERASELAQMVMRDNAIALYRL